MSIKVQAGVSASGSPAYKNLRFGNVKASATDADFYEIANAIAGLQSYPVAEIDRIDTANLVNG
jgi:hypothetical protein